MDFAKAFDTVNHSLLVHKLHHYGVRNSTNIWISNFLHGRKQAVVEGSRSAYIPVKFGVPQGSVHEPCLFLIYINDLTSRVSSFRLYRFIAASDDHEVLQSDLRNLEE